MINKESYGFKTFAANRIGEIQQSTNINEWARINGKQNVADVITRGLLPSQLNEHSIWQNGPDFLYMHENEWPISKDCKINEIPEVKVNVLQDTVSEEDSLAKRIDVNRFSKFKILINTTKRILRLYSIFKNGIDTTEKLLIEKAENFWIKEAQSIIETEIQTNQYKKLMPHKQNGIWLVGDAW